MTTPTSPPGIDASGLIPENFVAELVTAAAFESAVLSLGQQVPMPPGVSRIPILNSLPEAEFIGIGDRKPFTELGFGSYTLQVEEVALTTGIAQAYLDDSSIPIWPAVRPQLAAAIGRRIDGAALFGIRAPATFPNGGNGVVSAIDVVGGGDAFDRVSNAMGAVEASGVAPNGHAADLTVKGAFRGVRDNDGAFLLQDATTTNQLGTLYGLPISWHHPFGTPEVNFITGDWSLLRVGIRQDMRFELSDNGVIADGDGKVLISAFQDDMVLMRVYMRLGVALLPALTEVMDEDGYGHIEEVTGFAGTLLTGPGSAGGNSGDGGTGNGRRTVQQQPAKKAAPQKSAPAQG